MSEQSVENETKTERCRKVCMSEFSVAMILRLFLLLVHHFSLVVTVSSFQMAFWPLIYSIVAHFHDRFMCRSQILRLLQLQTQ